MVEFYRGRIPSECLARVRGGLKHSDAILDR
jgi:hypothetical protein